MRLSPVALALVLLAVAILLVFWQRNSAPVTRLKELISAFADKVEAGVNKLGLRLIVGWRRFYAMYSMWAFAAVGTAPDLYNLAVSTGMLDGQSAPVMLTRLINTIAFIGAASKLIEQKKLAAERDKAAITTAKEESDSSRL